EIERLLAHDLLKFVMPAAFGGSDARIAQLPGLLHGMQHVKVWAPVQQIVNLQEVKALYTPPGSRLSYLCRTVFGLRTPYLVGRKHRAKVACFFQTIANHFLSRTVHRGRIYQPPARLEKGSHDRCAFVTQGGVVTDIEGDPAAQAHGGDALLRGRYGFHEH